MHSLFVAWRSTDQRNPAWGPVARLDRDGSMYRFCYTRGAQRLSGFQPFVGMDDLSVPYLSDTLFPLFANRILSASRPEYEDFLRWSGFDPDDPPDPITFLAVTEGRRQADTVEVFPCPRPDSDERYLNKFFLHGVQWLSETAEERVNQLRVGERLFVMPDPGNKWDSDAVAVRTDEDKMLVGYVPRYLARDVVRLLYTCRSRPAQLTVERCNTEAPLQHRVLCQMQACWPEGFRPCDHDDFQPIAADVPAY